MSQFRQHMLNVVDVPLDEIERHPHNANQGDLEALEDSIRVNGFYQPVIIQASTGYIIAGNHRWEAALKMGAKTIPGIYLDVSDEEARRMMLADNRITRLGQDDPARLLELLDSLTDTDYGLLGTGFDASEYQSLLDSLEEPLDFEEEPKGENDHTVDPYFVDIGPRSDEGEALGLLVTRRDGEPLTPHDLNRVREALGLNRLSAGVIAQYDVKGWE